MAIGVHRARNGRDRIRAEGPAEGSSLGEPTAVVAPVADARHVVSVPVVAVQGGCGATTFAAFLGKEAGEAAVELPFGSAPPAAAVLASGNGLGHSPLSVWRGRCVVVVALGTAYGLKQAMDATSELLRHGVEVVVAVVADGVLAEPVPVRARIRTLRGVCRAVVRVPYVPRWRIDDEPAAAPPAYMAAVHTVRAALRLSDETGGSRRKEHTRAH